MTNTPRKRSAHVTLGVTGLAASMFLTGCGEQPDYSAICVDPQTQQRLDDDQCDDDGGDYHGGSGFYWFYMSTHSSHRAPGVGEHYNPSYGTYRGSTLTKSGHVVQKGGIPKSGVSSFKSYSKSGGFGGSRGFSSS